MSNEPRTQMDPDELAVVQPFTKEPDPEEPDNESDLIKPRGVTEDESAPGDTQSEPDPAARPGL